MNEEQPLQWVLLWSKDRSSLHVETLWQFMAEGLKALQENTRRPDDFVVVFCGSEASVREYAEDLHSTIERRKGAA